MRPRHETIVSTIISHIQQLSDYFRWYFGDNDVSMFDWMQNPFVYLRADLTDGREQEELADLSSYWTLFLQFNHITLASFWITCPRVSTAVDKVVNVLLLFATTCLYVISAFSAVIPVKSKYRASLVMYLSYCRTYHHVWTYSVNRPESDYLLKTDWMKLNEKLLKIDFSWLGVKKLTWLDLEQK